MAGSERYLGHGIRSAQTDQSRKVFDDIYRAHQTILASATQLSESSSTILHRYQNAELIEKISKIQSLQKTIDPEKLADASLLEKCKLATDSVLKAPDEWSFFIGASHLPFYAQAYLHRDIFLGFLGRKTIATKAFETTKELALAAAKECLGTVVPFLGIIEAVVNVTVPEIEHKIDDMQNAVKEMDRLFFFHNSLSSLTEKIEGIEKATFQVDRASQASARRIQADFEWLSDAFQTAQKIK